MVPSESRTVLFKISRNSPAYGTLIALAASGFSVEKSTEFTDEVLNEMILDGVKFTNDAAIARFIIRSSDRADELFGKDIVEQAQIDTWVTAVEQQLEHGGPLNDLLRLAEERLKSSPYLCLNRFTLADIMLWTIIAADEKVQQQKPFSTFFGKLLHDPVLAEAHSAVGRFTIKAPEKLDGCKKEELKALKQSVKEKEKPKSQEEKKMKERIKDEGKFIELPGAEIGKVVVRFPPEASGYLHIGHAKAALLNQYYQQAFSGQLIMRFDDTNPAKENAHYEQVILEDLKMLEVKPDRWSHTSDHFDKMLEMCERLLKEGKAYVDDTDAETMRKEREERKESRCRNNTPEQNLALWEEMKIATPKGQECCVRIKIDMQSNNGAMRDPTIYRCKAETHVRTGDKYKVYPTYDFACPIVDSVEGVTHALRTTEYTDRDEQYYFICDALGLRKPYIWSYARLNMTNTVMSKRKLTWLVDEHYVEGWDDPRLPTVRGVMRRGLTVEGLKQFIVAQGGSRAIVMMEWDKIWSFNKKVIDPIAPRYTALACTENPVRVTVAENVPEESKEVPQHPKNAEIGTKTIWYSKAIQVEEVDACEMKVGDTVTFINWGNMKICDIVRNGNKIAEIKAKLDLENKDYKKTLKVTWIAEAEQGPQIPVIAVEYSHIISKAIVGKDEDWKHFVDHDSVKTSEMIGEPALKEVRKGNIIQLQRKGFYICDSEYTPKSDFSGAEVPLVLIAIPDGSKPAGVIQEESRVNKGLVSKETVITNGSILANGNVPAGPLDVIELHKQVEEQGELVRSLKAGDPKGMKTKEAIAKLLDLKKAYKELSGEDYKPSSQPSPLQQAAIEAEKAENLYHRIEEQGNLVRTLKSENPKSEESKAAIAKLLELKKLYKDTTGQDYKPKPDPTVTNTSTSSAQDKSGTESAEDLYTQIEEQGNLVRSLKSANPKSEEAKAAIARLLELKKLYKDTAGQDYKPRPVSTAATTTSTSSVQVKSRAEAAEELHRQVEEQGNLVRNLKAANPKSDEAKAAITKLLDLKKQYKERTGSEYQPKPAETHKQPVEEQNSEELYKQIDEQGNLVRTLKAANPKSNEAKAAITKLLDLKKQYKEVTGTEYKPRTVTQSSNDKEQGSSASAKEVFATKIQQQGELVRSLKAKDAKSEAKDAVEDLLKLKKQYKAEFGEDYTLAAAPAVVSGDAAKRDKDAATVATNQAVKAGSKKGKNEKLESKPISSAKVTEVKKQTKLGLDVKKEENTADWYSQVITKADMIEYYDISGCYVLRPWSYAIWEVIKNWFDKEIKKLGVRNCYFPMFVSQNALEREKEHIADFAPEVAWVTRAGSSELSEPIAIRPTSETVMYPSFAKWVKSHRDLPLRLNQWCNIVRWEFKHPTPFLRTREFLWQEGHTAFQSAEEAEAEVFTILDLYAKVYTDLLAIPVTKGRKSEKEKFAGGDFTTTVEAYVPVNGRGIQGATSHHLGQNFSKMFNISFEDPETGERAFAWQNSWGLTTRTIGAVVIIHGDNNGLVLPPRVAPIQVIVIPVGITAQTDKKSKNEIIEKIEVVTKTLKNSNIRAESDLRDNYSPGWKFNHWELKGVPIRLELGPMDIAKSQVTCVIRRNGEKSAIPFDDLSSRCSELLDSIHNDMFINMERIRDEHRKITVDWTEFKELLEQKFSMLAPFCGLPECEERIKKDSSNEENIDLGAPGMGAKTLCIPLKQPTEKLPTHCIHPECKEQPKFYALFGRSY